MTNYQEHDAIATEEFRQLKKDYIEELKAIPEWYNKLAECHIKCSDLPVKLRFFIWMHIPGGELDALYKEAERLRNEQA